MEGRLGAVSQPTLSEGWLEHRQVEDLPLSCHRAQCLNGEAMSDSETFRATTDMYEKG